MKRRKAQSRAREAEAAPAERRRRSGRLKGRGRPAGLVRLYMGRGTRGWIAYKFAALAALNGVIPISGAKNAALPLMIASLMTDQTLTLENLPRLADVAQLAYILGNHGVDYSVDGKRVGEETGAGQTAHLRARTIVDTTAPTSWWRRCAPASG